MDITIGKGKTVLMSPRSLFSDDHERFYRQSENKTMLDLLDQRHWLVRDKKIRQMVIERLSYQVQIRNAFLDPVNDTTNKDPADITLLQYYLACLSFDSTYMYSDDASVCRSGRKYHNWLNSITAAHPEYLDICIGSAHDVVRLSTNCNLRELIEWHPDIKAVVPEGFYVVVGHIVSITLKETAIQYLKAAGMLGKLHSMAKEWGSPRHALHTPATPRGYFGVTCSSRCYDENGNEYIEHDLIRGVAAPEGTSAALTAFGNAIEKIWLDDLILNPADAEVELPESMSSMLSFDRNQFVRVTISNEMVEGQPRLAVIYFGDILFIHEFHNRVYRFYDKHSGIPIQVKQPVRHPRKKKSQPVDTTAAPVRKNNAPNKSKVRKPVKK